MYNFTYTDAMVKQGNPLCFAVQVYAIADKYGIKELQDLAAAKFKGKFIVKDNIEELTNAIALVNDMTNPADPTLWNILLPVVRDNIRTLLEDDTFKDFIFEMKDFTIKLLSTWNATSKNAKNDTFKTTGLSDSALQRMGEAYGKAIHDRAFAGRG